MKSLHLLLLLLFTSSHSVAQSQWVDYYGSTGELTIEGDQLSGTLFGDFVGTLSSTSNGYLFIGFWDDAIDANECGPNNAYAGPMKLLFNPDGTSFTGSFGYCRENTVHDDLSTVGGYTGSLQSGSLDFTGDSDVTPADLPTAVASLKWKNFGTAGFTWSTPVVLDDKVFLQDQDGGFDTFSINDGSTLYSKSVANAFPTNSPIFANGFIYMIADGLRKIDPENGNEVGHFANPSISSQSPAAFNDLVIVGDTSTVYGINVNTMTQVWSNDLGSTSEINMAISDEILYVFADKLYALNPVTGDEYWSVTPPENKGLYIGAVGSGYLSVFENDFSNTQLHTYQLNVSRTSPPILVWSADMGAGSADRSPPVIDDNLVFATSRVGVLKAFKLSGNGTTLWEKTVRSNGSASALPLATNGAVILQEEVSSNVFQLVGYNGFSGTEIFRTAITDMGISWGQPLVKDNVVYLATDHGGALYAVTVPGLPGQWSMIKGNAQLTGSSVSGVESKVDETTLTVDLPQLYVPGAGVFQTELTLVDRETLEFNINAAAALAINVPTSNLATFDTAISTLVIPAMIYQGVRYKVTFKLSSVNGDDYRFILTAMQLVE